MDAKQRITISKYLSKHLRHEPERSGLTLAEGGWVEVAELLAACARNQFPITRELLDEVVTTCDKQRFAFDATGTRIRANQGHSAPVDLQLEPRSPPWELFHGTPQQNVAAIMSEGLRRMARHHVHLSPDIETARKVGARRGKPAIFRIDAAAMLTAGQVFYCSDNGVWLV